MRRVEATAGSRPRLKFVLAGIGTKGDVFPLLALGRELVRRGHPCDLLSNEGYAELAQQHGLSFCPVTASQTNNLVSGRENLEQHVFPSYAPTFAYFAEQTRGATPLAVVNLDGCSASNLMCDRYALPSCRIYVQPQGIASLLRPPWPFRKKLEGPLSATYRKYRLPQIYAERSAPPYLIARINDYRREAGLGEVTNTHGLDAAVVKRMGLFPAWYAPPADDWPTGFELVGFPLPRSSSSLPLALEEFLQRETRPLVFTPGTGVTDVQAFFEDARRCCESLDRPGVFLSPHYRAPSEGLGSRIFHAAFVDLEPLLARAALLVHHGGIGTTARALQAGIPQVIRSVAYDQPDNGDRVARLGVGAFFEPDAYCYERLLSMTAGLLDSPEVRKQLDHLRAEIAGTDAMAAAARCLERTFDNVSSATSRFPLTAADAARARNPTHEPSSTFHRP